MLQQTEQYLVYSTPYFTSAGVSFSSKEAAPALFILSTSNTSSGLTYYGTRRPMISKPESDQNLKHVLFIENWVLKPKRQIVLQHLNLITADYNV